MSQRIVSFMILIIMFSLPTLVIPTVYANGAERHEQRFRMIG